MNKKLLIWIGVIFLAAVLGSYGYKTLGGFNEPVFKVKVAPTFYMLGRPYHGILADQAFGQLFNDAEKLKSGRFKNGVVAGYFYNETEKGTDTIKAFVGLLFEDSIAPIKGYSMLRINERKVVEATVNAHFLVAPANIYQKIKAFGEEQNITVKASPALEIYPKERQFVIQIPVVK
ncbi:MAG: hypothetical protein NVV82_10785 [Sporocytophaga sp.]|nr:hypothetical protein [Sporocytophaga sp.]